MLVYSLRGQIDGRGGRGYVGMVGINFENEDTQWGQNVSEMDK